MKRLRVWLYVEEIRAVLAQLSVGQCLVVSLWIGLVGMILGVMGTVVWLQDKSIVRAHAARWDGARYAGVSALTCPAEAICAGTTTNLLVLGSTNTTTLTGCESGDLRDAKGRVLRSDMAIDQRAVWACVAGRWERAQRGEPSTFLSRVPSSALLTP